MPRCHQGKRRREVGKRSARNRSSTQTCGCEFCSRNSHLKSHEPWMLIIPALGRWNQVVNTWPLQPASKACLASFGQMKDCLRQRGKWLLRNSSQGFPLTSNCTQEPMPSLPHTHTSRRIQGKTNR